MLSFDAVVLEDGVPIYLQIIRHVKRGVVAGTIRDGDELPSRRALSAGLGVNPNTVQKAYRMLEEEGLVLSHSGAKSAISLTPERARRIRDQLLEQEADATVRAMRQMGVDRAEALELIGRLWDRMEEEDGT